MHTRSPAFSKEMPGFFVTVLIRHPGVFLDLPAKTGGHESVPIHQICEPQGA